MKSAILALCLALSGGALAQTKTAQVSALEGTATKARGNAAPTALKQGTGLAQGDVVETGADSRMEIRFSDASVLRIGSKAKLQLTEAHFGSGPAKRKMTAKLFFGNLWAKVTSVIQGEQKFQVETENAVAGVRGTTFRVDANTDKSVLVRVFAGTVAVAKNVPIYATGKPGEERHEVQGPEEVTREQWEKLVGKQMQIFIAADGTPGDPQPITGEDDAFAKWNQERDAAGK
ncbi:MAG TPA: FecR family protein [Myxococcales bacterium]|nr:FecR family protein [Myxococcales bacterium]